MTYRLIIWEYAEENDQIWDIIEGKHEIFFTKSGRPTKLFSDRLLEVKNGRWCEFKPVTE